METVVEYFSRFDSLLNNHATDITSVRRTVRLIDLVMEKDLFDFLCWLVSDNERELHFSRNCAIKFIHCQAKNELLKVAIGSTSRCVFHTQDTSECWMKKVSLAWTKIYASKNLYSLTKGSSASSVSSVSSCSSSHSLKSTCTLTVGELESVRETVSVPLSPQPSPPSSPPRIQERVTDTEDNAIIVGSASASGSGAKEEPEMLLSYLLDTYRVERMIQQLQQRVGVVWKDSRSSSASAPDEEGEREEGDGDARSCASSKLTESCDESVSSSARRHGDVNGDDHGDLAAGSSDDLSLSSSATAQSTDSDRDDRAASPHSPSSPAPAPASASASSLLKLLTLLRQEQTTVLCGDNASDIGSQSGEMPAPPSGESAARTGDAPSHNAMGSTDCSELSMTTIYSLGPDSVATAVSDESVLRTNPLLADRRSHRSAAHTPLPPPSEAAHVVKSGRSPEEKRYCPCASSKSEADPVLLDSPSGAARPVAVAAPIPPPAPSPVPLLRCGRAGSSKESPSIDTGRPGSAALQADRSAASVRAGRKAASTAGPPPSPPPSPSASASAISPRPSAASKRSASNSSKVVAKAAVTVPGKVQSHPSAASALPTAGEAAGKLRASNLSARKAGKTDQQ